MWAFLRRQGLYFLLGFVLCFIVYLFVRFDPDAVFLGIVLSVAAGITLSTFLWWMEGRFKKSPPPPTRQ
jgi:hypothetical protein